MRVARPFECPGPARTLGWSGGADLPRSKEGGDETATEQQLTINAHPELKREMGIWTATAMVVGNMIGSGVFLLPAALAGVAVVYGSSALLAWVVTGAGAMLLAGVFATMGTGVPEDGWALRVRASRVR